MILNSELKYKTRIGQNGIEELPESKRKVFVSYRKKDNIYNLRDRIVDYILQAFDCAVWYDSSLTPGENYDEEIAVAIRECDVVILLLTKNVFDSSYIWDIEIKYALQYNKGIIPISLGIELNAYEKITEKIGHIHILSAEELFFAENSKEKYISEEKKFIDDLCRSLERFTVSHDVAKKVTDFFATQRDKLPFKVLTLEQIYLLAYGLLNGIGTESNVDNALHILDSIISVYCFDEETVKLKGEISFDLMIYYIKVSNVSKALEYGEKAIQYGCIKSSDFLGQMYLEGKLVTKNTEKAFGLFKIGVDKNNISSIRLVIDFLLSQNSLNDKQKYKAIQPYYEKAAIFGTEQDMLELIAFYWNIDEPNKISSLEKSKQYLDTHIINMLSNLVRTSKYDNIRVLSTEQKRDFDFGKLMMEIQFEGHIFKLYKKRVASNKSIVSLVCDDSVILYKQLCVWGYGECPTFDIAIEDGFLCLKRKSVAS